MMYASALAFVPPVLAVQPSLAEVFGPWFFYGVIAALVFTLVVILYVLLRIDSIRRGSRRAQRLVEDMKREWDSFNRNQSEQIRQEFHAFEERAGRLEESTQERVAGFEELVTRTREEVESLQSYLRDVFEVELKNLFDSFDSTVGSVLGEMKQELLRGVERLDHIQTVVDGRMATHDKMLEGRDRVRQLGIEAGVEAPVEAEAADEEARDAE